MIWLVVGLAALCVFILLVWLFPASVLKWPVVISTCLLSFIIYYFASPITSLEQHAKRQTQLETQIVTLIEHESELPKLDSKQLPDYAMVLQSFLQRNDKQPHGWYLLGMIYLSLQNAESAVLAFEKAVNIKPMSAPYVIGYARSLIWQNKGKLTQQSYELLSIVVSVRPKHQGAWMLLGMSAFSAGQYGLAVQAWKKLLALIEPTSDSAKLLQESIEHAKMLMDKK